MKSLGFNFLTGVALLLAASTIGCGERSILAHVGDETITVADFIEAAKGNNDRYAGNPDSAKALLLDDLIHRKLMIIEARRLSAPNQDILDKFGALVEDEVLTEALLDRLTPQEIRISSDEVRQFHALRDSAANMHVIFHPERIVLETALVELARGSDFAEVSSRLSLPGMLPAGGNLGFLLPGALVPPLDELLLEAPIGKLIGPIEAPGEGWFLVKVVERRARPLEPFESVEAQLRDVLRQRKRRVVSRNAIERLKKEYQITVEPGAPQVLFARFNRSPDGKFGAGTTPEDQKLDRVLARFDGGPQRNGTFTLLQALEDLEAGAGARPDPSLTTALEKWIEARTLSRVLIIEAKHRNLAAEPDVARRLRERYDNKLVDDIYHAEVEEKSALTAEDFAAAQQRLDLPAGPITEFSVQDQSNIRQVAGQYAGERRLKMFLASLRDRYPVQTFPERLLGIAWPVSPDSR